MNDLMSAASIACGSARWWPVAPRPGMAVLDVAGGTGDIARRVWEAMEGEGRVIVCDASEQMVDAGRERTWNAGLIGGIEWLVGDAEALPLPPRSVDAYTIAFGIRNLTRVERALEEAARVLRPGGRFLCLEFSSRPPAGVDRLYNAYSFAVIPLLGAAVTGQHGRLRLSCGEHPRFPRRSGLPP